MVNTLYGGPPNGIMQKDALRGSDRRGAMESRRVNNKWQRVG
jgi:hypothetical protein